MSRMLNSERGTVLAVVVMVLFTLGILGVSMCLRSVSEERSARRQVYSTQSFWLAEAGIQRSVWEIKKNSCQGFKNRASGAACTSCSCGGEMVLKTVLGTGEAETLIDASATTLMSTGYYPSQTAAIVQRAVKVRLGGGTPLFGYAAFSQGAMSFSNNALVDSYSSANGDYGGANVTAEGDIGTNSGALGAINLSNNVTILGSVSTGAGGTVTGNGTITGEVTHANNVEIVPVVVPSALASSADLGVMTFSNGETKTLSTGNYKYDHITFANNVILSIAGDVKLYLTGASGLQSGNNAQVKINTNATLTIYTEGVISFGNNVLLNNLSKKPSSFIIFSKYAGSNGVVISNNGSFYGAIYAAQTDVILSNNANVYGAMVGKTINVSNNDQVHFDQALESIIIPGTQVPVEWQEI